MSDLTRRQKEVLDCIIRGVVHNGMPPTYREIGEELNIKSTNGVSEHVNMLIKKATSSVRTTVVVWHVAWFSRINQKHLLERDVVSVPVLGTVAAGIPILAEEHADEVLKFDQSITGGHRHVFALRVKGESMINEGILDGDIVLVRKQETAKDGDIVVALIDGDATVKTFFRERSRIRVATCQRQYAPYLSDPSLTGICGKVIASFRHYR